ncbi:uncharacterized protein LOC124256843 isoform X2 [Haliotis rubra]|uniref:uncharacterized protein LOC124256843 isoform X2 n=1 Tax=Haliotis rubra TaxID=36100 RepID=UPI001EE5E5D3|nr:uncharacterized protein LOC124256843 isoform X2 [Haliotis rubra]
MKMPISAAQCDFVVGGCIHLLVIFICICLSSSASPPDFLCPDVVELHSRAVLNCSVSHTDTTVKYKGPGLNAPQCDLTQGKCTEFGVYRASISNNNTELVITNVSQSMAGEWKCTDDAGKISSSCNLQIFKTPSCSIRSDVQTDAVTAGEEVTLIVSIMSYFCSGASNFTLQTGNTSQTLDTAVDRTEAVNVSITVTDSHYGDVRLIFACHSHERNLSCAGITQLQKSAATYASTSRTGAISHFIILILCIGIVSITNSMLLGGL